MAHPYALLPWALRVGGGRAGAADLLMYRF